ncbi:MAG: hypothetical protein ACRBF0_19315 [Calditrichia bacterium]
MNVKTYIDHLRLQKWLKLYSEQQLEKSLTIKMQSHIDQCETCRLNLESMRELSTHIKAGYSPSAEDGALSKDLAWKKLVNKIDHPQSGKVRAGNWRHIGWAMACTLLLSTSIIFWWKGRTIPINSGISIQSSSSFDLTGLINAFHEPDLREAFYQSQGVIPISLGDCCLQQFYNAELLTSLQLHCASIKQRIFSSADGKSILLECKIADNTVAILQQKNGVQYNLPPELLEKKVITGVECEQLLKNGVSVIRWNQPNGQVIVVGSLPAKELEILIDASK